jgi:hypothetical protein
MVFAKVGAQQAKANNTAEARGAVFMAILEDERAATD